MNHKLTKRMSRSSSVRSTPRDRVFLLKDRPLDGSRPTPADNSGYWPA
ncbi:hypothetical protein [Streptomyces sp. NPDC003660]